MGRDLTLYPQKASKKDLKTYLERLGFEKCNHLWDWPKATLNYAWFDADDFKSIDGVSADIYPVSGDELKITGNPWALHVRNLYSASWYDVKMLNTVLRDAKKLFGGQIRGDYGTNKYAPLWKDDSTSISRGISSIYQQVKRELEAVKFSLPNPMMSRPLQKKGNSDDLIEFVNSLDPSRTIYNGLVPFAVSMFEFFFSRIFQVLITYDKFAVEKKSSYKMKVNFDSLLAVGRRSQTVENVIASSYSFQNLNSLNKAYTEWLNVDVRKILYKKRKIGSSIKFLENKIAEIIQYRHGIIHHFEIDRSLTKDGYLGILNAIEKSMVEFICFLEGKYSMRVEKN
jgi:hypothetical protein